MEKIKGKDFISQRLSDKFNNDVIAKFLMQLKSYNKFNKIYSKNFDKDGIEFIDSVIDSLGINFEIDEADISRIPLTGAFITVSNQPFGGIDGLLLLKIIIGKRPDFKLLANFLLHNIEPLTQFSIPINELSDNSNIKFSFTYLKKTLNHIENGKPLGIFPAAEISKVHSLNNISDRKWQNTLIKLIKNAEVPVVPVYFQGNNSWIYHLLGNINPFLQTARLSREFFNKKRKTIKIRIGKPISVKEQKEFKDIETISRFLRAKTYALGSPLEIKKFFRPKFIARTKKVEKIIDPVPADKILKEINFLKEKYFLFNSKEYSIMCGPSIETPNILTEIGRLREITFREVGEGSNRSLDIDEFDLYFSQLIIWDNDNQKIAGAYRVGRGDQIMQQFGVKGFYIQSLFNIKKEFNKILEESIELGRSFIIKEYQKKPLSLFLLWKGILYFLLKNREYRYLIGPASISNDFSKFSQSLIIDFFKENFFNNDLAKYIVPRKRFKIKHNPNFDNEVFIKNTSSDVKKLDKFIQDIEPDYNTPVLFKKYIQLNAKLLGFNVDPKFNNCVDGLMILDIFDVPLNTLQSLSKELEDESILERFNF
ncbi:MAG: lysophospholipid acyltransferase family protein [Bacteroidales bacterium]|nr:lysophospholipid acyltransferase family protein [Bacteroidales bacterium]